MKVKIFKQTGYSFSFKKRPESKQLLEDQINSWLQENSGISIKEIQQSACGGSLEPSITIISVWYD